MARKLRLEYEGACYHVLNRGNQRSDLFADDGAKHSFLKCLWKGPEDISGDAKGSLWKVVIAAEMKRRTTASNPWLSKRLNMGSPFRLSRLVSSCDQATGDAQKLGLNVQSANSDPFPAPSRAQTIRRQLHIVRVDQQDTGCFGKVVDYGSVLSEHRGDGEKRYQQRRFHVRSETGS